MPRPDLSYIELTDFSPGIFSNNNLAGGVNVTSDNPCKAQEAGTYRCISLPTGGLGPLPRRVESVGLTTPPGPPSTTYTVSGMQTWGRIRPTSPSDSDTGSRYEIHLGLQWVDAGTTHYAWVRERSFEASKGTDTIDTATDPGGNTPRFSWFHKTRMNPADPDDPGTPVMVFVGSMVDNVLPRSLAWPDPSAPSTNATIAVGDPDVYLLSTAHQGRIVLAQRIDYAHGTNALLATSENLLWTNVNEPGLSSATPAQVVPEVDQSIADLCSMAANQLVVIKAYGGGYVLQGDLDDVTVLRLPNLMCPDGGPTVKGINTAKGFVYSAGFNGIYLWNGGDQATQISQQLDGETFTTGQGVSTRGHGGQCDRWANLVLAPRNWVWQTEENRQGWWRLEDTDDLLIRLWSTTSDVSRLVGVESSFTDDDAFIHQWDFNDLAYSWSWRSHPLWVSQPRRLEIRQGLVALQGHGIVTITLLDETGETSPHPIAIDHDNIRNYRWDIGLDAENLIVQIEAEGTRDDDDQLNGEAPLVHRMFLGCTDAQSLRNANQ